MKKKTIVILITIFILLGIITLFLINNKRYKNSDSIRFKNEYESLNNTIRASDGKTYNYVEIDYKNPIKYISVEESLSILESKKAIIYIGANWCPWCRNMLKAMFDVAKDLKIDTIYYLTLDDDKSNYEIKDGKLIKISDGSDAYYKLLDKLKEFLKDFELTEGKNTYPTGEKRIYMPFFITVKNGSIIEAKGISRELEQGQNKYSENTEKQYQNLYSDFYDTFRKVYISNNVCNHEDTCN